VETEVEYPPGRNVGRSCQELRFQRLPIQNQVVRLIPDCAHDSKIVGAIALRWWGCYAASVARELAGVALYLMTGIWGQNVDLLYLSYGLALESGTLALYLSAGPRNAANGGRCWTIVAALWKPFSRRYTEYFEAA
jgi:hypothetical protein